MENSSLVRLIRSFNSVEKREVSEFLRSPFFNQRQDVITLFQTLLAEKTTDKLQVWEKIHGTTPYDDPKMRHLMSYLHQLLEDYLALREIMDDHHLLQLKRAVAYRKRGLAIAFEKTATALEKSLEDQPLRNLTYYETKHKSLWEAHQLAYSVNPADTAKLQEIHQTTDIIYLTEKLKLICLFEAHQSVYKASNHESSTAPIIQMAEQPAYCEIPAVSTFLHCFYMLRYPNEEAHFYQLKRLLTAHSALFTSEEMHSFFILAINHCVKKINTGNQHIIPEVLDLYKEGLAKNYLLEDGVLSRFTYHNIVAAGLSIAETEWVRFFIHQYKNQIEKKYRESSYSYNLARLEYSCKNYDVVMDLLQKANYRDPLLNLQAKTLLIKTYYDLAEFDLLQSHLDAMRNYIHRKVILGGYHRTNYLNIIKYTEKLIRLKPHDKKSALSLLEAITREPTLTEKQFFQGALAQIG